MRGAYERPVMPTHDEAARYRQAVDALPPLTRAVFLLHRVGGLGYARVAERMEIGGDEVTVHIATAIYRITRALD